MADAEWTAGELRTWLRAQRRARRRGWADWYYLGFAIVVIAAMAGSFLNGVQLPLWQCAPDAVSCLAGLTLLPLLWTAATVVGVSSLASLLGPLAVSAAEGAFLLSLPVDRAELLTPEVRRVVLVGLAVGLVSGVLLWLATAHSPVWIIGCGLAGSLAVLAAVLAQQAGWTSLWRLGVGALGALAVPATLELVGLAPPPAVALLAAVALSLLTWRCWTRVRSGLATMTRWSLVRQGQLRASLAGAVSTADTNLVLDVVGLRLVGSPGRPLLVNARTRWGALAGLEVNRLIRRSPRLLIGVAIATVFSANAPAAPSMVLAIAAIALVPALGLLLTSLRKVTLAPGLRRAIGLAPLAQVTALAAGAVLAVVGWVAWSSALLLAGGLPLSSALLLAGSAGVAGLAGALRRIAVPAPDFTSGFVLTEAGALPVSALMTAASGFGTTLLISVMVLTDTSPVACALAALLALLWSIRAATRSLRR